MSNRVNAILTTFLIIIYITVPLQVSGQQAPKDDQPGAERFGKSSRPVLQAAPGRLLVKFRADLPEGDADNLAREYGMRAQRQLSRLNIRVMNVPANVDEKVYAEWLKSRPEVEYAEPDYILYPDSMTPNDPLYASEWHLPVITCGDAWAYTTGSNQVVIAVCDTGVDPTQPDLADKLVPGWNVVDDNADTTPAHPHGTWVAGVAAAAGNNGIGVAAPAMDCRIMPVRFSTSTNGSAMLSDMVDAICWAADHGARVANVSYTGFGSPALSDAAKYLQSKHGVLVMAAGNWGAYLEIPDDPNIITVSGTNQSDGLASFTATGPFVDLAAPGVGIMTTGLQNTYLSVSGTSFSSPLVASAAALLVSVNPQLTPTQIDSLLKLSADDLGPAGYDPGYGWGRLNIARAVGLAQALLNGSPDMTAPAARFLQPKSGGIIGQSRGDLIQVDAIDDRAVTALKLFGDGSLIGERTSSPSALPAASPASFYWDTSAFANGSPHTLTAIAQDAAGHTTTTSMPVTVRAGYDATPPQITITSPDNGQKVGGNVRVTVDVFDNMGAVTYIELYIDNVFVTYSNTRPFTMRWSPSHNARGLRTLMCKTYDLAGNIGTSPPVTVMVK